MSAFKDIVAADMDDVFLNSEEFAEEHDLNGTVCICVVESPTTQGRFKKGKDYEGQDAVHGLTAIIHVKKSDIGEMPTEGQAFSLDGSYSEVDSCVEHMGMLTITLRENISGVSGAGGWDA
ncbi:MAG: hypothetical protein IJ521_06230 [Schwartzia sp.]|nr:hypothetical protein [Schwartzia sp. (in: firmicutes)]